MRLWQQAWMKCVAFTAPSESMGPLLVMTPTAWWRVPMQNLSMGLPTDSAAQNRIHKMMLQSFQYKRPKKYWVLKGFHGFRLKEFFDTYPDATLVWLHRDPVQVAASSTAMMRDIMEGIVGKIDMVEEVKMHLLRTRMSNQNTMSNPLIDDPRIQLSTSLLGFGEHT